MFSKESSRHFSCLDVLRAAGLGHPQQKGQELLFRCPRHEDRHPSLSINPNKDVWMCGPCGVGGNAWALAAFCAGVQPDDKKGVIDWLRGVKLFEDRLDTGELVASYVYTDENGDPLFQVSRYRIPKTGKKFFIQSRPDGNGGWIPRITDKEGNLLVRLVPYRLADFLEKPLVFIVEGEGDVDELRNLGLIATCNPMGAGNWKPEFAQYFKDKRVAIIPDNDSLGEKHAFQVASNLFPVAKWIKIIRLPDLPPKGDISDWIRAWR